MIDRNKNIITNVIAMFCLLLLTQTPARVQAAETALDTYVARPDANYSYNLYHTEQGTGYTAYFLEMTSQQWRSSNEVDRPIWTHDVMIVIPKIALESTHTAVLLVSGGSNSSNHPTSVDSTVGAAAVTTGAVLAVVSQIPNQPLYFTDEAGVGRKEDEILAYSLDKALDTGDPEWAVHLAMTKAAVRAMDTVQTFTASKGKTINDFLVIGGSKRGWTTWLTAAVDPRVKAIVPASIDLLNLGQQFVHHWEAYGFYAPALQDYVAFDLPCRMQTTEGQALLRVIDPYAYRERYTMPKLILNSAGDQFFVSDSSRFYYGALPGPKWLRYMPNTDHYQDEQVAINALSWMNDILNNDSSPQIGWTLDNDGALRVSPSIHPKQVRLWQASNPSARDFRLESIGSAWTSQVLTDAGDGTYVGRVQQPTTGWTAFFVEVTFPTAGVLEPDQVYTTEIQITPDTLPYAGTACSGSYHKALSHLESPQQGSFESGIGLIRGWACDAGSVEVQIDNGARQQVAYGSYRPDTAAVCGDTDNGFGYTFNWNNLGAGSHRLRTYVSGAEIADVNFQVTTLGVEYLQGVSGEYTLPNFPQTGKSVTVRWAEPHQNFVIVGSGQTQASTLQSVQATALAHLESPQQGSYESGIGLIRGWICNASSVEVQIDGGNRQRVAYGSNRPDTADICGDTNNGFGYTVNWNLFGNGLHHVQVYADGVAFADVNFQVTTLGVEYLQGVSGEYTLPNFPQTGKSVTLRWTEPNQNFRIVNYQ